MRLFVTEFITGGGLANDPLPESLKQEGQSMLQAVLNDCSRLHDLQLVTTRDARVDFDLKHDIQVHQVEDSIDYMQQLSLVASQCDTTWVIAPESEGVLQSIISHLANEKVMLINCDAESIGIAADKLTCAVYLAEHDILTIECLSQDQLVSYQNQVMIKRRYGVSCDGLMRCDNGKEALQQIDNFDQWVVQPYVQGRHLSMSVLCSNDSVKVASMNEQIFINEKQPRLKVCSVNAMSVTKETQQLAENIFSALPGLRGYVGVDIIQNDKGYYVVDINPRLTSSYVGLCDVLNINPAKLCIESVVKNKLPGQIPLNTNIAEVTVA